MSWPDLTGQRFGKLVVEGLANRPRGKGRFWVCVCDCGGTIEVPTRFLNFGSTQHCGCSRKPHVLPPRRRTHGEAHHLNKSPEYRSWCSMWTRCRNPNYAEAHLYSGRGITVCDRWKSYENFLEDMGRRPTPQHSLDRIDVNGNYTPENCRWADNFEQGRNKRNNRYITFRGETLCHADWARKAGVHPSTLHERLGRYGDQAGLALYFPLDQPRLFEDDPAPPAPPPVTGDLCRVPGCLGGRRCPAHGGQ